MSLNKIRELAGLKRLSERYETSAEWDNDYDALSRHIKDALTIIDSHNWKSHIADTDSNFDVNTVAINNDLKTALYTVETHVKKLMKEMLKAE